MKQQSIQVLTFLFSIMPLRTYIFITALYNTDSNIYIYIYRYSSIGSLNRIFCRTTRSASLSCEKDTLRSRSLLKCFRFAAFNCRNLCVA